MKSIYNYETLLKRQLKSYTKIIIFMIHLQILYPNLNQDATISKKLSDFDKTINFSNNNRNTDYRFKNNESFSSSFLVYKGRPLFLLDTRLNHTLFNNDFFDINTGTCNYPNWKCQSSYLNLLRVSIKKLYDSKSFYEHKNIFNLD